MRKSTLILTLFFLVIFSVNVSASEFVYNLFTGTITINSSSAPVGSVLSATIGGVAAGNYTIESAGWYAMAVTKPSGATTNVIVFSLSGVSGYSSINTISSTSYDPAKETGVPVKVNLAFIGAGGTPVEEAGSGAGSGGGAAATPAETVTTPTKVTDTQLLTEIFSWINPAELGLAVLSSENVIVTQLSSLLDTKTVSASDVLGLVDVVTSAEAKSVLEAMKDIADKGGAVSLSIEKKVSVYKIQSKVDNKVIERSKVTITVTAPTDLIDIKIVEVIPKTVAEKASELKFIGDAPKILQADPIVQWEISSMAKGLSKVLTYIVPKKLVAVDSKTITLGTEGKLGEVEVVTPEVPPVPPTKTYWGWVIAIAVVIFGLWLYFKGKKASRNL